MDIQYENDNYVHDEVIYAYNGKMCNKTPMWDSFQDPPAWRAKGSEAYKGKLHFALKLFKLFTYLFVFCIILTTSIASKLSLLLILANINQIAAIKYCHITDSSNYYVMQASPAHNIVWLWTLIICYTVPEFLTFLRALRFVIFKALQKFTWPEFALVVTFELLHVIGLVVLLVVCLPHLDSCRAFMLFNCISFIPAMLKLRSNRTLHWKQVFHAILGICALLAQISGFVVWPLLSDKLCLKILALPLILISARWWENYCLANRLPIIKRRIAKYQIYIYLAPLKILVFALLACFLHGRPLSEYFDLFLHTLKPQNLTIQQLNLNLSAEITQTKQNTILLKSNPSAIIYTMLVQIVSSYICYIFAKFASKIKIQEFSLALALNLASPMGVALVYLLSMLRETDVCLLHEYVPDYLSLRPLNLECEQYLWVWLLWWLSQIYITWHIWQPKNDKNAPTDKLFVCPGYCGLLIDQCVAMNRRILDSNEPFTYNLQKIIDVKQKELFEEDKVPKLIVCATMWHETQEEMMEFLKSVMRLDEDQCARRMARLHINKGKRVVDESYYELEINIFFDDAFILEKKLCENLRNPPLNKYVQTLIGSIEKAAYEVYGVNMKIKSPTKTETPYGGRLEWILPGRNKMITHLKNKDKIRHKKRWSQVMYMYYLLGYRIMQVPNISPRRKAIIAENTFLLALDGDIDFQPQAVQLLIDRMKAIDDLGAACGRIHPVGRGPMIWYQKFEYAIGHWLQKATEHVIGCVLCSPGCFSLFRGSSLMQNSVIKKYTTVSQEPMHYIQYDQGEDRWLCTLLLKQGLRVEYSAAADAFTHSPETFNEFYNQRRRWVPSTMANILDLLSDADIVVRNNSSISTPYILYQMMLTVGTILSPGTIFLMMVGAVVAVFNVSIWTAFLWNFFPVLLFILCCIYFQQQLQLLLAFVISTLYCLVMMAVLIGVIIQIIEDGPLAPASLFFLLVFLQILIAGVLHPQEVGALLCGIIYYITIPSMYMLLMIYSVFNMNDVSWGTRDITQETATEDNDSLQHEIELLPGWMNDPLLLDSQLGEITLDEKCFWKELIRQYLRPLFQSKSAKEDVSNSLKNLRNIFAFAFMMINAIFVLIVFLLQLKKEFLHLDWPIDPIDFISYDNMNSQIFIYRRYKELDPIGLCFVIFFGLLLIIQFVAMFFHRFATISQLLAATQLDWIVGNKQMSEADMEREVRGNAVHIARQLQRPKRFNEYDVIDDDVENQYDVVDDDDDDDDEQVSNGEEHSEIYIVGNLQNSIWRASQNSKNINESKRQRLMFKLQANQNKQQQDYSDLPQNFERRFYGTENIEVDIGRTRASLNMIKSNRNFNSADLDCYQLYYENPAYDNAINC